MRTLDDIIARPGEVPNLDAIVNRASESMGDRLKRRAAELCETAERLKENSEAAIVAIQGFVSAAGRISNLRKCSSEPDDVSLLDYEHEKSGHTFTVACADNYISKFLDNPLDPDDREFIGGIRKAWDTATGKKVYYSIPIYEWKIESYDPTGGKFCLSNPSGWTAWGWCYIGKKKINELHDKGSLYPVRGILQEIWDEEDDLVNGRLFNGLADFLSSTTP
jgi:hypothetical protein